MLSFPEIPKFNGSPNVQLITPEGAKQMMEDGGAVLVDIREPDEFVRERIEGARLAPLSALPYLPLREDLGRSVIYFCASGRRTKNQIVLLAKRGFSSTYIMDGGLDAWRKAGLPTIKERQPLSLQRQTFIAIGMLLMFILAIALLSKTPAVLWLVAIVAIMMINAGVTGWCGMTLFLLKMPWNRSKLTGGVVQTIKNEESCHIDTKK